MKLKMEAELKKIMRSRVQKKMMKMGLKRKMMVERKRMVKKMIKKKGKKEKKVSFYVKAIDVKSAFYTS